MEKDVLATFDYINEYLHGSLFRRELLRIALEDTGWRENGTLNIIDGRRYQYKGFKKGVAIEGQFAAYEHILEGLFRLQVGFDKGNIETGILLLTSQRSDKSKLGTSLDLARTEVEILYPTISMPVTIGLFDLGSPYLPDGDDDKGGHEHGTPVLSQEKELEEEDWGDSEPYP